MMSRFFVPLFILFFLPNVAFAETSIEEETPWLEKSAIERPFALGAYVMNWSGDYVAGGVGLRSRWEPFDLLGVDLFSEHLVVDDDAGFRHDHPIGFNLYIPITLFEIRIRPLFGFCAVFSFTETENAGTERVDDIMFGVHGGLGLELALGRFVSVFFESQATGYLGHQRYDSPGAWSVQVEDSLSSSSFVISNALGFQIHL